MNVESAFPSKYLKQSDLNGRAVRVTIASIDVEDVGDGDRKLVMYFEKKEKGMVINRTNADAISGSFGQETDDWIGQVIEIYADPEIRYAGKKVGGLRVRVPRIANGPVVDNRPQHTAPPRQQPMHSDERSPPIEDDEIPFNYAA